MTAPSTTTETAAKPAAKRTRKPAAKADTTPDVVTEDGRTADELKKLFVYEATGRFGVTNRRTFDREMAVAVDVKDPSHTSPRWQGGLITRFFVNEASAAKYIERQEGCDCQIVPAVLVDTKEA